MQVFISYSHIDDNFVQQLATMLDEKNIPHFLDKKSIQWGDSISGSVEEGLRTASHIIVVISPASLKSSWVPYEIGLARALGVRVLPLLTHPSLDVPGFIADLSYKTSLDDLEGFFDESIRLNSTLELTLMAGHMDVLDDPPGYIGINHFEPEKDEIPTDSLPYFELSVKNTGGEPIEIKDPHFEFQREQYIPGNENGYQEISFNINEEVSRIRLRPQGTKVFESSFYGACLVSRAFLEENMKRIYLEDDQGFVSEVGIAQIETAANYCRWFFAKIDLQELLDSKIDTE